MFDDLQSKEYKLTLNGKSWKNLDTSTLYFRFCQKINKCTNIDTETFAVIINNEGKSEEECIPLVYTD